MRGRKNAADKERRTEWGTPERIFDYLNQEFEFTRDVCGIAENAKLDDYIPPDLDGLLPEHWKGQRIWCNPPYSQPGQWLRRGYEEVKAGRCELAVFLVPASIDTKWFDLAACGEIDLFRGRIQFEPPKGINRSSSPGPVMLVTFDATTLKDTATGLLNVRRRDCKTGEMI